MKLKLKKKVLRGIGGRDLWSVVGGGAETLLCPDSTLLCPETTGCPESDQCPETQTETTSEACPQSECTEECNFTCGYSTCSSGLDTCDSTGTCNTEGCSGY